MLEAANLGDTEGCQTLPTIPTLVVLEFGVEAGYLTTLHRLSTIFLPLLVSQRIQKKATLTLKSDAELQKWLSSCLDYNNTKTV